MPDASTENGTKWQPDDSDAYFLRLKSTAVDDDPGKADEAVMSEGANLSEQVASHISDLPCRNGKTVMSSGRQPSPWSSLTGSSTELVPAASRVCLMMSFRAE